MTPPRDRDEECGRQEEGYRDVHRIGDGSHDDGAEDLAPIRHGAQPADRDAMQR